MNIGILTAATPQLRQQAETDVPSDTQTQAAADAVIVVAAAKPRPTVNVAPATRYPSMRAALDAQVAADVSAGRLSPDDAVAVGATLDAIDNRAAAPGVTNNPPAAVRAYLSTIPRGILVDRAA